MKDEIHQRLHGILAGTPRVINHILLEKAGGHDFKRQIYADLEQRLRLFLNSSQSCQWIIMPGLRGVGKTTLLAQLYSDPLLKDYSKFYLSLDAAWQIGANMLDVQKVIEERLGSAIATYQKPLFLFLDEVHFLPDWSLAIKILVDTSSHVFIVCTGSSALNLQANPDSARRSDVITIHPLSFMEFIANQQSQTQDNNGVINQSLSLQIKKALFESRNVDEAAQRLQIIVPEIQAYWSKIPDYKLMIDKYLRYGTLPFAVTAHYKAQTTKAVAATNELMSIEEENLINQTVWQQVMRTLHSAFARDIPSIKEFDSPTLTTFLQLVTALTYAEAPGLTKLSGKLELNIGTIQEMLTALCHSEIIIIAKPRGTGIGHVRKPNKYLFATPALRAAIAHSLEPGFMDDPLGWSQFRGRLLEDLVASYLKRLFIYMQLGGSLEYDPAEQGADFIISRGFRKDAIVIEVGMNKDNAKQAIKTLRKGGRYGLIFNDNVSSNVPTDYYKVDSKNKILSVTSAVFLLL